MAALYASLEPAKPGYFDRRFEGSYEEYQNALSRSTTLYVGNLSFYTTEEQVLELFSMCGDVRQVIMGLNKIDKKPAGFCFVVFYLRKDAERAARHLNKLKLDDRVIRVDFDTGFTPDRQFGRGQAGGQVRDELREDFDKGRGGYGGAASVARNARAQPTAYTQFEAGAGVAPLPPPPGSSAARQQAEVAELLAAREASAAAAKSGQKRGRDGDGDGDGGEGAGAGGGSSAGGGESAKNPRFREERTAGDDDDDE